jgi:5-methylcytosine-specific restriction endonuclease McrA
MGDLWQADHHIPVAEGGGECDISNYRTLCTACHIKETRELQKRLKERKLESAARGSKDIRQMFTNAPTQRRGQ